MDVAMAYLFAGLGYCMKVTAWPRIPMMIALVLGPLFERNFLLVLQLSEVGKLDLWDRPIAVFISFMVLVAVGYPLARRLNERGSFTRV